MNLSEKVLDIITLRSQELYSLLQFVRDIDAYISHQAQDIEGMVPDMPSSIKKEFKQYVTEKVNPSAPKPCLNIYFK